MVASAYPKPFQGYAKVAQKVHSPLTQTKTLRLELPKNHLVSEHRLVFSITQAFGIAPTGFDVRKIVDRIQYILKGGNLIDVDGVQLFDMDFYFGGASYSNLVLGLNSSVDVAVDVHFENDQALHDLQTALHANQLNTFDLQITFTDSLGFIGGLSSPVPVAAVAASAAGVVPVVAAVPAIPAANQQINFDVDAKFYEAYDNHSELGLMLHKRASLRKSGIGSGLQDAWKLTLGGINRIFMLHFYTLNADGSLTPNDGILSKITFKVNDKIERTYEAFELKFDAFKDRNGFNSPGCYVIDFGDDEAGWADFSNTIKEVTESTLIVESMAGSPAKWICNVMQDSVVTLASLNG